MEDGWYDIDELKHVTDAAWIVCIDNEEFALPKSQCEVDDEDDPTSICIPDWLAKKENLL